MRTWVILLSTSHQCWALTQRASASMRKCADWVNLKFVYSWLEPVHHANGVRPAVALSLSNVTYSFHHVLGLNQVSITSLDLHWRHTLKTALIQRQKKVLVSLVHVCVLCVHTHASKNCSTGTCNAQTWTNELPHFASGWGCPQFVISLRKVYWELALTAMFEVKQWECTHVYVSQWETFWTSTRAPFGPVTYTIAV